MAVKTFKFRKNLFISFLLSYIVILFIPVFISGLIYYKASNIVTQQVLDTNNLYLTQLKQGVDSIFANIDKISMELGISNKDILSLIMKDEILDSDRMLVFQVCQKLKQYKLDNPYMDNIYIYLKKTSTILDSDNKANDYVYYNLYFKDKIDYNAWYQLIQSDTGRAVTTLPALGEGDKDALVYIQSFPVQSPSSSVANLIITIDKKKLFDNLEEYRTISKGEVLIIDKDNNILLSTDKIENVDSIRFDKFTGSKDSIKFGESIYSYTDSDVLPLKYVTAITKKAFWEIVLYYKKVYIAGISLALAIGGALVIYMARKNYNPVKDIVEKIVQSGIQKKEEKKNEYHFIQDAIVRTVNEKEKALTLLDNKNMLLRDNYIKRLLREKVEFQDDVKDMLKGYGIDFDKNDIIVIHIAILGGVAGARDLLLTKEIINEYLQPNPELRENSILIEGEDCPLVLILNIEYKEEEGYKNGIRNLLYKISDKLKKKLGIQICMAVSDVHNVLSGFHICSSEAGSALEYALLNSQFTIIFYNDIKKSTFGYNYTLDSKQGILSFVREGNYEEAKKLIEGLLNCNYEDMFLPSEMMRGLIFDIILSIIRTLNRSEDLLFLEELQPINRLLSCKSINTMREEVFTILAAICSYVSENDQNVARIKLVKNIQEYISCYYWDKDMNVNTIGLHFDLTPHYLAKIYKDEVGISILHYIDTRRIERAKQLLCSENLTVYEVADAVGYTNSHALIRAFKKYEGVTPGKYKQQYAEKLVGNEGDRNEGNRDDGIQSENIVI